MRAVSSKGDSGHIAADVIRERHLRDGLRQVLESSVSWQRDFKAENDFSDSTGLRTRGDYAAKITLHLPEIYEESFRVEALAKRFLQSHTNGTLEDLAVGLQHLGRNHIGFVLQTLEWAADEGSWHLQN